MMRSMYSGVAGLKTHQTKMDVIGNNIANVNTTSYKSQSINFSDLMYQTTSRASGPNATTGRAGVNAKQIGLGVQSAAISTSITSAGATQTTGNPFDIKINGEAFFVVSGDGKSNYFTRDGSFYVDAAGNLAMSSTGYNVMGWLPDPSTEGTTIKKDSVQALRVLSAANMTYPPESTTEAYVEGILDKLEPDAATSAGKTMNLSFFDALGYSYTARFSIHETETKGQYTVQLDDILNADGDSLVDVYEVNSISEIAKFGETGTSEVTELVSMLDGVTYTRGATRADDIYSKKAAVANVFSTDYATKAIKGLEYKPATTGSNVIADGDSFSGGDTVTLTATGTITRADMEKYNGLMFVKRDAAGNGPYYHYTKADGSNVDLDAASTADPDKWKEALGLTGTLSNVSMDADGNVTFTHTDDFNVDAGKEGVYKDSSFTINITREEAYGLDTSANNGKTYNFDDVAEDGQARITTTTTYSGNILEFDTDSGKFKSINNANAVTLDFNESATDKGGKVTSLANFSDINIDWSNTTWFANGGSSTITAQSGTEGAGIGAGRKLGQMSGVSIQQDGTIYATYDNGMTRLLGQIAVAKFANAAGLEKAGDNLYAATLNSGEFDGVGVDITADGVGSMSTGCLEMSNVDLSAEFTEMITTQRGFQANSRIITVSDTLLEELVNLKR